MLRVVLSHSSLATSGGEARGSAKPLVSSNSGIKVSWKSGRKRNGRSNGSMTASIGKGAGGAGCSGSYGGTSLMVSGYGIISTSGMSGYVAGGGRSETLKPSNPLVLPLELPIAASAARIASRASAAESPVRLERSTRGWYSSSSSCSGVGSGTSGIGGRSTVFGCTLTSRSSCCVHHSPSFLSFSSTAASSSSENVKSFRKTSRSFSSSS
mmetsp:Transcript_45593/g.126862  ORF Transcript_45593/g.126862 Transcript_45593/m.126862 type:complete len:211 (+) Transcript_45593:404-1036(+)